jgi:hypothetical protein
MNAACLTPDLPAADCLQNVIEPLASYICAADHPRAALRIALQLLAAEVATTNRAARAHVTSYAAAN